jgi:hypothetical protein
MSAGPALKAGGAGIGAYGDLASGYAAAAASDYNAELAENNADITEAKAVEDERKARIIARKSLGSMRANFASSGFTLEGSALDVLQESAANAELDALNIKYAGEAKAAAFRGEAAIERFKAKEQRKGAKIGAASTLLSGGASVADGY